MPRLAAPHLLVYLLALLTNSCAEHIGWDRLPLTRGNGDTFARAMAVDSAGNLIIVGETYASNLGTPGSWQPSHQSAANIQLLSASGEEFEPIGPAPESRPFFAASDPAHPEELYLWQGILPAYRLNADRQWLPVAVGSAAVDESNLLSFAVAQNTAYAKIQLRTPASAFPLLLSTDRGAHWSPTAPSPGHGAPVPDPANPCIALDGSLPSSTATLVRTTDCALRWDVVPAPGLNISRPTPFPAGPAATRWIGQAVDLTTSLYQLVESRDAGHTWTRLGRLPQFFETFAPDPARDSAYYAASRDGVFYVGAPGAQWTRVYSWADAGLRDLTALQLLADPLSRRILISGTAKRPGSGISEAFVAATRDRFATVRLLVPPEREESIQLAPAPAGGTWMWRTPRPDAFVAKFSPTGQLRFFTYLGGTGVDQALSVSIGKEDRIWVTGRSDSPDLPGVAPTTSAGNGFVAELTSDGSQLRWLRRLASPTAVAAAPAGGGYCGGISGGDLRTTESYINHYSEEGTLLATQYRAFGKINSLLARGQDRVLVAVGNYLMQWTPSTGDYARFGSLDGVEIRDLRGLADGSVLAAGRSMIGNPGVSLEWLTSADAFQRRSGGPQNIMTVAPRDGFLARLAPDGGTLAATLFGGNAVEGFVGAIADAGGNVMAVGTGAGPGTPYYSASSLATSPGTSYETGLMARFDAPLAKPYFATVLDDVIPVGITPHPEGGYLVAGYGADDFRRGGTKDLQLLRIRSRPATLPRLDRMEGIPRAGATVDLIGEGFVSSSVVSWGDRAIAPDTVTSTRLRVRIPADTAPDVYAVQVSSGALRSDAVRMRVFR